MIKALEALRYECDYEDHHKGGTNYILRSHLPVGVGGKTLSDLLQAGLIETGPNQWHGGTGFRITAAGCNAII